MMVKNRQIVQDEIADFLKIDFASYLGVDGVNPIVAISQIYGYMPAKLNGASPVVLVLGAPVARAYAGVGTAKYENEMEIEIHHLVYDGAENNPLSEENRERTMNLMEAYNAQSCAARQRGTNYRALRRNGPTDRTAIKYLDGNPYQLEIIKILVEAPDV